MPKYIKKSAKNKSSLDISIQTRVNQQKLSRSIKKSLSGLPIDDVEVTFSGKGNQDILSLLTGLIILVIVIMSVGFAYFESTHKLNNSCPTTAQPKEVIKIVNISPPPINKALNIQIANGTFVSGLARNFKYILNQNNFNSVVVNNNFHQEVITTIRFKSQYKSEAEYLKANFYSLVNSQLIQDDQLSNCDINLILGKNIYK